MPAAAAVGADRGGGAALLTDLATAYESSGTATTAESGKGGNNGALPTPLTIYRTGLILYDLRRRCRAAAGSYSATDDDETPESRTLTENYQSLSKGFATVMESLPTSYVRDVVLGEINGAFVSVVGGCDDDGDYGKRLDSDPDTTAVAAVRSMCGLYGSLPGTTVCRLGFDGKVCLALTVLYDRVGGLGSSSADREEMVGCIFATLASLLLDGLILPSGSGGGKTEEEDVDDDGGGDSALGSVMETVQSLTADGTNCCLGDLQEWQVQKQKQTARTATLIDAVRSTFPDNPQRDYLMLMLKSCPTTDTLTARQLEMGIAGSRGPPDLKKKTGSKKKKKAHAPLTAPSAVDRLVAQVRDVLPSLGVGYVEVALVVYGHDANRTITALLESEADPSKLHPRLRALDRNLPARRKENKGYYDVDDDDDDGAREAKEVQKAMMKGMEVKAEREAYAVGLVDKTDMYDDDYDDQYDGFGDDGGATGKLGAADGGTYDVDLDAVREYNRVKREEEGESGFWEENRNLNRERGKDRKKKAGGAPASNDDGGEGESNDDGGEKKYRGPDKGKGGRLIGPDGKYLPIKKGGKKGKQQQQQQQQQAAANGVDSGGGGGTSRDGGKPSGAGSQQGKKKKGGTSGGGGGGGAEGAASKKQSSSDNMTKIQKRRKDANKAKVANHHRKERATRKAGGAM